MARSRFVKGMAPVTRPRSAIALRPRHCRVQQLMNEFAEGWGLEFEWLSVLLGGTPSERVSPDETERVAQHEAE
jgi:hypothetical protein